jgi:hypothetical protein
MVAGRTSAADVTTAIDEGNDATQGLVYEADRLNAQRAAVFGVDLDKLADGDKKLAKHMEEIARRLDERMRFGHLALELAEQQLWVKEGNAAVRQAGASGNFLAWMDEFYENHLALCVEKFGLAAAMLGVPVQGLARMHVTKSRKLLLAATECSRDELIESITACVAKWGHARGLNRGETSDDDADES